MPVGTWASRISLHLRVSNPTNFPVQSLEQLKLSLSEERDNDSPFSWTGYQSAKSDRPGEISGLPQKAITTFMHGLLRQLYGNCRSLTPATNNLPLRPGAVDPPRPGSSPSITCFNMPPTFPPCSSGTRRPFPDPAALPRPLVV